MHLINPLLALLQSVLVVGLAYDYVLLLAGARRPAAYLSEKHPSKGSGPVFRTGSAAEQLPCVHYAIAIPAQNESAVIGASVAHILGMDYPQHLFRVHVVADYCTDDTYAEARAAGAVAHERREGPRGRKGYALAWLFDRLLADPEHYDAIVVFDADSRPAPDFFKRLAQRLAQGALVVQGRHVIANPQDSAFSALADADMRLCNRIRNQSKENLGLSARLMGDGMCFHRSILEQYPWQSIRSLTEDREYGIYLVTQGQRVRFASDAVSRGQAATRWQDATTQRLRWDGGVYHLQKRYLGALGHAAWGNRDPAALDVMLELLLPSFSVLAVLAAGLVLARAALAFLKLAGPGSLALAAGSLGLFILYPFAGLALERAPRPAYRALALGPAYAAWRVWISIQVGLKRGKVEWIRTRRREEVGAKPVA